MEVIRVDRVPIDLYSEFFGEMVDVFFAGGAVVQVSQRKPAFGGV
jgi:hypothetical protein